MVNDCKEFQKGELVPAHPPEDYKGTQADWLCELEMRGLEWGENIDQDTWWEILESCETPDE